MQVFTLIYLFSALTRAFLQKDLKQWNKMIEIFPGFESQFFQW